MQPFESYNSAYSQGTHVCQPGVSVTNDDDDVYQGQYPQAGIHIAKLYFTNMNDTVFEHVQ
jgi:hypothetical protein